MNTAVRPRRMKIGLLGQTSLERGLGLLVQCWDMTPMGVVGVWFEEEIPPEEIETESTDSSL